MKKNLFKTASLFFLAILVIVSACKKEDADSQSAEDAARSMDIMADAFALSNDANGGGKTLLKGFSEECYEIIIFDGGFDIVFNECIDDYGVYRDGTLRVTAAPEAWDHESASTGITIEYIDFTHNDYGIDGNITAVVGFGNIISSLTQHIYFTLKTTFFQITHPDGDISKINSADYNYVIKASSIEFFGNTDGVNRNGVAYTSETESVEFGTYLDPCPWPTSGTTTITIEGENDIIIEYDQDQDGSCDNIFLVTQNKHKDVELTFN